MHDYQFARLAQRLRHYLHPKAESPPVTEFMTRARELADFDPKLAEERDLRQQIREMQAVMGGCLPNAEEDTGTPGG